MKKLLVIDTFNFLHRAYHALPKTLTDIEGSPINAVYGVTSMLINVFSTIKPDYVIAALDGRKPTFRLEEFTGYKAHRRPMDDALSVQIPKVIEVIDAFGISRYQIDGYEADDVIATVVSQFSDQVDIVVVSNDRDLWQLTDYPNTLILSPSTKTGTKPSWINSEEVIDKMGFAPKYIADYKGLRGDPSDNIPGVYGVGDKTARKLIDSYQTVENIYNHIDEVEPKSLQKKLVECAEQAVMSKNLAKLIYDVPAEISLEESAYKEFNKVKVKQVLEKYNFKSLIKRLGFAPDKKTAQVSDNQMALF